MDNIEYGTLATYYDLFYTNKNYDNETAFLINLIGDRKNILDAGCGTGTHAHLLGNKGYNVDAFDLSYSMVKLANEKINGKAYQGNLLSFNNGKTYDAIISMYAVFNHLNNYDELISGITNLYNMLNDDGILIIDFHNGRNSGRKEDIINNIKRTMTWKYDEENHKEITNINYNINGHEYNTGHMFMIYELDYLKFLLNGLGLNYKLLENYSLSPARDESKNVELIIYK